MRKAYSVEDKESYEPCIVIVFADTPSKAKSIVHKTEGFDCEWIDLVAKRCPEADKYESSHAPNLVDWGSKSGERIYYDLEWRMNEANHCDCCGRFESENIPESLIEETDDGDNCKSCREENSK